MKIVLTGHLGTLGQPLLRELRDRGHTVHGVDLRHDADAESTRADIADYRQIEAVLRDTRPDIVYHLAAEFGRHNGEDYYEQLWRSNVIGTRNILELQRDMGFRLMLTSSSEVYGEIDADWLDEGLMDREPVTQPNDYAITKWVNEVQARNFAARYGNDIVTARLFNAYGPGEHYHAYRSVVCLFVYRALMGLPFDVYKGYHRVFMYIDDLIPTLASAGTMGEGGQVYNIGGVEYRSVEDLAALVLEETGADDGLVQMKQTDHHNRKNKRPAIKRAVERLGHDPTVTLEEGIPKTVEWMRGLYGQSGAKAAA